MTRSVGSSCCRCRIRMSVVKPGIFTADMMHRVAAALATCPATVAGTFIRLGGVLDTSAHCRKFHNLIKQDSIGEVGMTRFLKRHRAVRPTSWSVSSSRSHVTGSTCSSTSSDSTTALLASRFSGMWNNVCTWVYTYRHRLQKQHIVLLSSPLDQHLARFALSRDLPPSYRPSRPVTALT